MFLLLLLLPSIGTDLRPTHYVRDLAKNLGKFWKKKNQLANKSTEQQQQTTKNIAKPIQVYEGGVSVKMQIEHK